MQLSQEEQPLVVDASQPVNHTLPEEILNVLFRLQPSGLAEGEQRDQAVRDQAEAIMAMLIQTGHVIPGAPPAKQILHDAQQFASQLILSKLAARILNMLAFSNVKTPETKPARKWIDDYLEGKNHGPIGRPMLWPGGLLGMAQLLRDWGFIPTIAQPGQPPYVAKAVQQATVQ